MIICLDVGNTHIFGGVFENNKYILTFRIDTHSGITSDQFGVFLKNVLRENNIDPDKTQNISIGSVVPSIDYSLRSACIKYFDINPFFLKAGVRTGLMIKYYNPSEVGADRIANAIAAVEQFPDKDIIIADFGTATVFCAVTATKEYLGGAILPGMRLSMEALHKNTAKLSAVEILRPNHPIGKSTTESIQSGIYLNQIGAMREFLFRCKENNYFSENPLIIGTGGFSHLFEEEKLFHAIIPNLALHGLRLALEKNTI
ncbi:MAG: type III pantothenate kinase [Verrucomicrobia bacterium]|nr:MAG: type III pantothenate kinase [Verrucomicrobiota bacterium]